ncbi:MAG: hypothetical protein SH850_01735 [Planctomycetaceae bacterium]|nr:hypothetical protein [Planctomycetaceae bacterium]
MPVSVTGRPAEDPDDVPEVATAAEESSAELIRRDRLEQWEKENPLAEDYADRYAHAIDSFEEMLGGWFEIHHPRGEVWDHSGESGGSLYRPATDDEAAIAKMTLHCGIDIDLRGDIGAQLLAGFRRLSRRCRIASRDVTVALAAGTLDLRPMLGFVPVRDGVPLCEPCSKNNAWRAAVKLDAEDVVPVFDDSDDTMEGVAS